VTWMWFVNVAAATMLEKGEDCTEDFGTTVTRMETEASCLLSDPCCNQDIQCLAKTVKLKTVRSSFSNSGSHAIQKN